MALWALSWPVVGHGQTTGGPVERLAASQRAAVRSAPELAARLSELAAAEAAARSERAPGTPYVEWQSEGFSSAFDRRPNAQDTLRLGTPFNLPSHWKKGRRLEEATVGWTEAGRRAARIELAAEVGRRWLDLAATLDRGAVVRRRLARLDQALSLQEARYQLGEVAGTEVAQLDLEQVRESSRLADLEAQEQALRARLRELCGDGCVEPETDDVETLVGLSAPYHGPVTRELLESSAPYRSAEGEAEAARARAELVSSTAWGRPLVEAEWERLPDVEGVPGFDAWGVRVSMPLPIGSAGRQLRAAARAEAVAAESNIETLRRRFRRQAEAEVATAEGAARRLAALHTVLEDLERFEHSLSEQFRLGAIRYLEYIDGLSRLDEVRLEAIEARGQLLRSRLELAVMFGDTTLFPLEVDDPKEDS
jgi:outer membrane protein TolC